MYSKLERIGFIFCFALVLGSVLIVKGADLCNVDLPEWTGTDQKRSLLEGRAYEKFPKPTLETISNSEFQDSFEQYVSDTVPRRDDVLLFNAGFQRAGISTAASALGYSVYPTFYGSDYVYDIEHDMVAPMPTKKSDERAEKYLRTADVVNSFAGSHPDIHTVFCEVDRLEYSKGNPAASLVEDSVDRAYVRKNLLDLMSDNVTVVDLAVEDTDTFLSDYYRSDHHWNMNGAYKGYTQILSALRPDEDPLVLGEIEQWGDTPFYGSNARASLCDIDEADSIFDYRYEESNLDVILEGKESSVEGLRHKEKYDSGKAAADKYTNRYAEYFHTDFSVIEIRNESSNNEESLLIVADSFSNCMERLLAEHYRTVYVIDPRHYDDGTINSFVDDHPVNDVAIVIGGTNYTGDEFLDFMAE